MDHAGWMVEAGFQLLLKQFHVALKVPEGKIRLTIGLWVNKPKE